MLRRCFAYKNVCEARLETCCVFHTANILELTLILYTRARRSSAKCRSLSFERTYNSFIQEAVWSHRLPPLVTSRRRHVRSTKRWKIDNHKKSCQYINNTMCQTKSFLGNLVCFKLVVMHDLRNSLSYLQREYHTFESI